MNQLRIFLENGVLPEGFSGVEDNTKYVFRGKGSALANCIPQTVSTANHYSFRREGVASNGSVELITGTVQVSGRAKPAYFIAGPSGGSYVQLADVSLSGFPAEYANEWDWFAHTPVWDSVNSVFAFLIRSSSFDTVRLVKVDVSTPASPTTTVVNFSTGATSDAMPSASANTVLFQAIAGVPYMHLYARSRTTATRGLMTINLNTNLNVDVAGFKSWESLGMHGAGPEYIALAKGDNLIVNSLLGKLANAPMSVHIVHPLTGVSTHVKPTITAPSGANPINTSWNWNSRVSYDSTEDKYIGLATIGFSGPQGGNKMFVYTIAHPATLGGTQVVAGTLTAEPTGRTTFPTPTLYAKTAAGQYFFQSIGETWAVSISSGTVTIGSPVYAASPPAQVFIGLLNQSFYNKTAGYVVWIDTWSFTGSGRPHTRSADGLTVKSSFSNWSTLSETITISLTSLTFTQAFSALWLPPESSAEAPKPITVLASNLDPSGEPITGNFMLNIESGNALESQGQPGKATGQMRHVGTNNITNMAPGCILTGAGRILFFSNF